MRFLAKIALMIVVNAFALSLSARIVGGFVLAGDIMSIIWVACICTLINLVVKPVLKIILSPVIVLTLGLGLIAVNAVLLKILDFLSKDLTIESVSALFFGTLIVSAMNVIAHVATKKSS